MNSRLQTKWKDRYSFTTTIYGIQATDNPSRILCASNDSGVFQAYVMDLESGVYTQVTHKPTGTLFARLSSDGAYVFFQQDEGGNELGHLVRCHVDSGKVIDLTPDLPPYGFSASAEASGRLTFIAPSSRGFEVYQIEGATSDTVSEPKLLWNSPALTSGLTISRDGKRIAVLNCARSNSIATSLIVLDASSGDFIAELYDEGASIEGGGPGNAVHFSPLAGDDRILAATTRSGFSRPVIWNPDTNERIEIPLDELDGDVEVWGWSPNAERILLCHVYQAQTQLYLYDVTAQELLKIPHAPGSYGVALSFLLGGQFATHGELLLTVSSFEQPGQLVFLTPETGSISRVLRAPKEALQGRSFKSVQFPSTHGVTIQAWLGVPSGAGPFPAVIDIHGGPSSAQMNDYSPDAEAWLDHGFAWISVNYRGSTTFGKDFQHAINGRLGDVEVDDIVAARQFLIEHGIARPEAIFVTGASYGGYLTLQTLGRVPHGWAAGMADIAIADWKLMYEDQSESLRGYQVALFGGTPEQKPEAHAFASPITYAQDYEAPLLIIQGKNDTRCPERQMRFFIEKMRAKEKELRIHWFEAGHGALKTDERIEQQEMRMAFALEILERIEATQG